MPNKMPDWRGFLNSVSVRIPTPFPSFGSQLHNYRTMRGLSVERLAEAVGLAPSAIREMEAGKRSAPPEDIAVALADFLQLTKDERELFLDSAEMASPIMHALTGKNAPTAEQPTMTAAILVFLIADIRGYTHFTQEEGDEAAARLTTRFAELAHAAVEQWDGQLVEARGDEILAVFASARQALRAAHMLQARCDEETQLHPELPLRVGIGLDLGEAVPIDGGGYRGAALNRAARLCSLAGAGQVLVSTGIVYVAPHIEGITFIAHGQEQLKGFDGPTPILLAAPTATIDADAEADGSAE